VEADWEMDGVEMDGVRAARQINVTGENSCGQHQAGKPARRHGKTGNRHKTNGWILGSIQKSITLASAGEVQPEKLARIVLSAKRAT